MNVEIRACETTSSCRQCNEGMVQWQEMAVSHGYQPHERGVSAWRRGALLPFLLHDLPTVSRHCLLPWPFRWPKILP
jgi:hypothetical protein